MENKHDVKLEAQLVKLGFKKHWLSDKSGYWFEKKLKSKDFKSKLIVETEYGFLTMEAIVSDGFYNDRKFVFKSGNYETIGQYKLSLAEVKRLIKKYDK